MPEGKGTYGSKVGRPKKKDKGIMGESISGLKAGLKGLKKDARKFNYQRRGKATGGMVKGYSTGGSVSRGQYPSQARKVKFKGVF
jgi:hypothetical protein